MWKAIDGFDGLYEVSDTGLIRSISRYVDHKRHGKQFIAERILKPGIDGGGYLHVYLRKGGISHMRKVHRTVAIAFIPNPDNLPEVNHGDGNKLNCAAWNLNWTSASDNQLHAYSTGLNKARKGNDNSLSRKVMQVDKSGNLIATFESTTEAERITGIASQSISCCANGRKHYKTAGGFKWAYKSEK